MGGRRERQEVARQPVRVSILPAPMAMMGAAEPDWCRPILAMLMDVSLLDDDRVLINRGILVGPSGRVHQRVSRMFQDGN